MNAVSMLVKEHTEIKGYFKRFEGAAKGARQKKLEIAEEVLKEIRTHAQIEEQVFYPAVQRKGSKEMQELILSGLEEHRVADFLMEKLDGITPDDETFEAKFEVLMESVRHHLKEEEKELFPKARKRMASMLDELGDEMNALHIQLEGEPA